MFWRDDRSRERKVSAADSPALTLELAREMANMRIYAEIMAQSLAARGQLQGHWTMAPHRAYTIRFGWQESTSAAEGDSSESRAAPTKVAASTT